MTDSSPSDVVLSIAISPSLADGICFAARESGLYRTDDSGRTWHLAYESLNLPEALPTHAVALSPDFIHDQTVLAGVSGGVLRSTDGGLHWQAYRFAAPPPVVTTLAFSPNYAEDGILFCGTFDDGVFCSTDRGGRWATWNFGLLDLQILCMAVSCEQCSRAFAEDETLYVGTESGIYRSRNAGRAWKATAFPMEAAPVISLALSPGDSEKPGVSERRSLAPTPGFSACAGTESGELFVSNDGGSQWSLAARFEDAVNQIIVGADWQHKPELLVLAGTSLQYSSDAGKTWTERPIQLPVPTQITCIAAPFGISPSDSLLVGTVDAGVVLV